MEDRRNKTPAQERPAREVFQVLWSVCRNQKFRIFAILFTAAAAELAQSVITPLYYKQFVNTLTKAVQNPAVAKTLFWILGMIAGIRLLGLLLGFLKGKVNTTFQISVMSRLRIMAYENVLGHSYRFFTDSFTGSIVHKINDLSSSFENLADAIMLDIWTLLFSTVGVLTVVFLRDVWIGLIVSVWLVVTVIGNYIYAMRRLEHDYERAAKNTIAGGILSDGIANALNIKAFVRVPEEVSRFKKADEEFRTVQTYTWETGQRADLTRGLSILLLELSVMGLVLYRWSSGGFSVGDVVLFQSYIISLQGKTSNIGWVIRRIFTSVADAKEGVEILNRPHDVRDVRKAKALKVKRGEISFQEVNFNYNQTRTILKDFSLQIAPQEKIALVGSSGAGKSTVTKLLFRFYDVDGGKISIDGQNISKVTQDSLHEQIALVPQEPILFHRSLRENIGYGKRNATEGEIINAAMQAHCHEFIASLPQGYDTLVGERGIKLSGGERQRVAIARAILKNAPILILDEATSSLDSESEALIQDALRELMKNKTVIVIAHRLSTIMQMDRIVVMEDGHVADSGTHNELLKKTGTYQKLWSIQAGGFLQ